MQKPKLLAKKKNYEKPEEMGLMQKAIAISDIFKVFSLNSSFNTFVMSKNQQLHHVLIK